MTTLLWFRRDLRLADNPALDAAVAIGRPVIPIAGRNSERSEIRTATERAATADRLRSELRSLVDAVHARDLVLLHFAGHGVVGEDGRRCHFNSDRSQCGPV